MEDSSDPPSFDPKPSTSSKKTGLFHVMKRPSLQSLRTSSFFQTSTSQDYSNSASRARSLSVVSPTAHATFDDVETIPIPAPSSSLLDEDPFANLRSPPPDVPEHPSAYSNTSVALYPPRSSSVLLPSQALLQHHTPKRPKSSGHGQVRPASARPAFSPRPSLPSLHTLAQMNIGIPRKARKGTPGARLPHEPWNMDPNNNLGPALDSSTEPPSRHVATVPQIPMPLDATRDFTRISSVDTLVSSSTSDRTLVDSDDSVTSSRSADRRSASVFHDDAEIDSLPSLSYTASEPSSSALSRSSSIRSSPWSKTSIDQNSVSINHARAPGMFFAHEHDVVDEDDPLSYHSDFDYYTQPHSDYSNSDSDLPSKARYQAPSPEITPTPYTSLYSPDTSSDFVRSVHTMPGVLHKLPRNNVLLSSSPRPEDEPRDGSGAPEQRGSSPRRGGDDDRKDRGRKDESYSGNNGSGGYGHGSGGNGGDRGRRPITHSPAWSDSEYSSSSGEGDNGTVYYSVDGTSNGHSSRPQSLARPVHTRMISGSDDDVPLAQSMPTALKAQRSIRKQLRDERHQRRMERASTRAAMATAQPSVPILPHTVTHSRQRSSSAAPAPRGKPVFIEPFPVDDLAKKLASLQMGIPPLSAPPSSNNMAASASLSSRIPIPSFVPLPFRPQAMDEMGFLQHAPPYTLENPLQGGQLRSTRSFHRPGGRTADKAQPSVESSSSQHLGRRPTGALRRAEDQPIRRDKSVARPSRDDMEGRHGLDRRAEDQPIRRDKSITRPSREGMEGRNGSDPHLRSTRPSEDNRRPTPTIPRASTDQDTGQRILQRPPVPAVELIQPRAAPLHIAKLTVTQQRVFIGDMQRFNMVEITDNTTAGDVITLVASQGSLDHTPVWMLFELANDFGMERPIRSYELLRDVTSSWNKDKLLNAFVIRRTYLAPSLSRSNIPTSSPTHRGYVEWESKKGKWSKRWMELREHSLWLSKRDTGKDETFLCSLSNFDAYYVTRKHKSPKPFVFAIKSTDNISLFEEVSDYLHVLSCNQKDGEKWMEAILVARSYVLFQERHILFAKSGGDFTPNPNIVPRSRTRGQSVSTRPIQPLVNVSAPFSPSATAGVVFEPGSLLAKRKGDVMS